MSSVPVLEVRNIVKRFGAVVANDGISITARAGEVFGLLGPNGAGKTTLVRQILGSAIPTAGTIAIGGVDVVARPDIARRLCSFQPQTGVPLDNLQPVQAIELVARIRGATKTEARTETRRMVDDLDIAEWASTPCARLSGGVLRLVTFALSAVRPGKVVILDEPTNDVDPLRRRLLWHQVRVLADAGAAVLLVTHNVLEAERAVDRLAVIDHGKVAAAGTPAELKSGFASSFRLEVTPATDPPPFARVTTRAGHRLVCDVHDDDVETALAWARRQRDAGEIDEFSLGPASLEDVYATLVTAHA